ncbi:glycoside hydrolase family 15 protein [Streptomyces amakusaensis]|uniref:Glycoside hydrolase family 15 protein n=1 Tax=Streptomyces amakusaensis TaxID=67271 RepID=A0ABW0AN43_9ACTN
MSRIEDHALIGDLQTAALVDRNGTADWLCLPRFDSAAMFTRLLGGPEHGHWTITPAPAPDAGDTDPPQAVRRRYRGNSLILETEWDTPDGTVRVTDFMPSTVGVRGDAPRLVRIVEGVHGRVPVRSVLRPRPGYGTVVPWIRAEGDRFAALAGPDALWLDAEPPTTDENSTLVSEFTVAAGDRVAFTLAWHPSHAGIPPLPDPRADLTATAAYWKDWTARCTYTGPDRDAVVRSLITLKALTYAPTGAMVAAPTTSLPEEIGGTRNWDYRYCWLRDSALAVTTLARNGYLDEARAWRAWLVRTVGGDLDRLQIMYGIAGERDLAERELAHLPGYENSRPVRVGNGAAAQLQLDVFGEVIDALDTARRHGLEPCPRAAALQVRLVELLERRWREPDEGIWEVRGPRRHFVHSKVMAWVAFDRVIRLIESGDATGPAERWRGLRDEIHREVCERGFDSVRGTFTQSYGSAELDAALLLIPVVGFLPPGDPRVTGTVEAVRRELSTPDGFVLRYPTAGPGAGVDGLAGEEGAFLACSFWMADALALTGRPDEARELFEKLLALRNDVGLLAEEWGPQRRRQVGNFPQGFSHWALVDSAVALARGTGAFVPGQRAHLPSAVQRSLRPAVVA